MVLTPLIPIRFPRLRAHSNRQKGVSLIELLLSVVMVAGVVITLAVASSKISQNSQRNRQRWIATNLANSQIAVLQSKAYNYVVATSPGIFPLSITNCDCRQLDFTLLPSSSTLAAGTVFNLATCVHVVSTGTVANTWDSRCPLDGDTGDKHILVRVAWTAGTYPSQVTQESMVTPY